MIDYYAKVAPAIIPHLAGRALTLRRFPEGVDRSDAAFFEKRCPKHRPDWVRTARIAIGGRTGEIDFCVCDDLPTLVWMAQLAAVELHPSLSPGPGAGTPDRARLRPRSRPAGRRRRVLPGRPVAARDVRPPRARVLPEDIGLEGHAGLPAAQRRDQLRRDQALRPRDRPAAREADPRRGRLEDEEGRPQGQGVRRLVARTTSARRRSPSTRCGPASAPPPRPRSTGTRWSGPPSTSDPGSLVFEASEVLERIERRRRPLRTGARAPRRSCRNSPGSPGECRKVLRRLLPPYMHVPASCEPRRLNGITCGGFAAFHACARANTARASINWRLARRSRPAAPFGRAATPTAARAGGMLAEELRVGLVDRRELAELGRVDGQAQGAIEARPRRLAHRLQVLQALGRLSRPGSRRRSRRCRDRGGSARSRRGGRRGGSPGCRGRWPPGAHRRSGRLTSRCSSRASSYSGWVMSRIS